MPNLTTIADWARSLGISRQQGYAALERCGIPVNDGKVDVEYATHLYHKHTRVRANGQRAGNPAGAEQVDGGQSGGPETKQKVPGYDTSRARREAAEAAKAEIQLNELAGKYLVKDEVDGVMFEIARALRDGMVNCARRIAADVAPLTSADECEAVIEREHRALLESMVQALADKLAVRMDGHEA